MVNQITDTIKRPYLKIKASMGVAYAKSKTPWIAIMYPAVSNSPYEGLCVAYLFPEDMSGFYLCITHGCKQYTNIFKKPNIAEAMVKVSSFINSKVFDSNDKPNISLRAYTENDTEKRLDLGVVCCKHYNIRTVTDKELKKDLNDYIIKYGLILKWLNHRPFTEIIKEAAGSDDMNDDIIPPEKPKSTDSPIPEDDFKLSQKECEDILGSKDLDYYTFKNPVPIIKTTEKAVMIINPGLDGEISKEDYSKLIQFSEDPDDLSIAGETITVPLRFAGSEIVFLPKSQIKMDKNWDHVLKIHKEFYVYGIDKKRMFKDSDENLVIKAATYKHAIDVLKEAGFDADYSDPWKKLIEPIKKYNLKF